MFICAQCVRVSLPRSSGFTRVIQTREVSFPFRKGAQRQPGRCPEGRSDPRDPTKYDKCKDDHGGHGTQIVKEERICRKCHDSNLSKAQREKEE